MNHHDIYTMPDLPRLMAPQGWRRWVHFLLRIHIAPKYFAVMAPPNKIFIHPANLPELQALLTRRGHTFTVVRQYKPHLKAIKHDKKEDREPPR